jgi:hypothetical protein
MHLAALPDSAGNVLAERLHRVSVLVRNDEHYALEHAYAGWKRALPRS